MLRSVALRAVAYLRGNEIPAQKQRVHACAERHGYQLLHSVLDEDTSGLLTIGGNGGLWSVLTKLHSQEAEVVIIDNPRVLADDVLHQEALLAHLEAIDVKVMFASDTAVKEPDKDRKLLRSYHQILRELDGKLRGFKLRAGAARKKALSGKNAQGKKPFKASLDGRNALQRIRKLQEQDFNLAAIARTLNQEGVKTRHGKKWHSTTIAKMLGQRQRRKPLKDSPIERDSTT